MDAYRLESGAEAAELDIDSMLAEGTLIVEWPERITRVLPLEELRINMDFIAEEQRQMRFKAKGLHHDQILSELQQALFGVS
jgi:tRNA A37 threonylcarbamoyladenosine biosynthesis protein TsaE